MVSQLLVREASFWVVRVSVFSNPYLRREIKSLAKD